MSAFNHQEHELVTMIAIMLSEAFGRRVFGSVDPVQDVARFDLGSVGYALSLRMLESDQFRVSTPMWASLAISGLDDELSRRRAQRAKLAPLVDAIVSVLSAPRTDDDYDRP